MVTRLYQAGPMSILKKEGWGREPAREVTEFLRGLGYQVVSPWELDEAMGMDFSKETTPGWFDYEKTLHKDFEVIDGCDGIVLMEGWEASPGAQREREHAIASNKVVLLLVRDKLWGWRLLDDIRVPFQAAWSEEDILDGVTHGEVRIIDLNTGGAKGQKLAREGSLDPWAMNKIAEVAGFGETKYDRLNFLKGYAWSLSYDALVRHLRCFWEGFDYDEESGLPHLAHAAWHCQALMAFMHHDLGTDDRYRKA